MSDILFIVNGSKNIGMGHISRCIKLHDYIKDKSSQNKIAFLSFTDDLASMVLRQNKIRQIKLKQADDLAEIQKHLSKIRAKVIINDTWENNPLSYYQFLKTHSKKLVVLDDSQYAQSAADLLINISPARFMKVKRKRKDLTLYQGLKYLLLPFNIDTFHYEVTGDILIFFGGTDFRDAAMDLTKKLALRLCDKKFTVIGKPGVHLPSNVRLILPFSYPVTSLLKFHNIVITSGATAMFEAIYFKKPTFAFAAQPWEKDNIECLEKINLVKYLGSFEDDIGQLAEKFLIFLRSSLKFDFNTPYIDGKGLERIGKAILRITKA